MSQFEHWSKSAEFLYYSLILCCGPEAAAYLAYPSREKADVDFAFRKKTAGKAFLEKALHEALKESLDQLLEQIKSLSDVSPEDWALARDIYPRLERRLQKLESLVVLNDERVSKLVSLDGIKQSLGVFRKMTNALVGSKPASNFDLRGDTPHSIYHLSQLEGAIESLPVWGTGHFIIGADRSIWLGGSFTLLAKAVKDEFGNNQRWFMAFGELQRIPQGINLKPPRYYPQSSPELTPTKLSLEEAAKRFEEFGYKGNVNICIL